MTNTTSSNTASTTALLAVDDLAIHVGGRALLQGISFRLHAGEALSLVGESGAGKSLLAQAIMGNLPPALRASGSITIDGVTTRAEDAASRRALWGRKLALLPQEPTVALNPLQRVAPQLAEVYTLLHGQPQGEAAARAQQELARAGLGQATAHYPWQLSGGMAQRAVAAITLAGGKGRLLSFDVGNREQCREVIEQNIDTHGAWYGVVSNAGITRDGAFPALSEDDWDSVIHTNLDSFYNVIHPCIMPMIGTRQGGRIITLSSVSGVMGNRGQVNYSAAKAGIIGATKALAIELAKRKITVNCIAPGLINTGMIEMEEAALKEAMSIIPMKRMGQAEEVAGLASYLMSDIAGYVTRQVISINGGML